ncbi:Ig-like domain-containing protein [Oerskovia flava]|uniref:Ig-like domain-containing protein n=1 Tax=Oerskovia flava TaxID=2986422 RepID=UPI00223FFF26|nr:Ig-like domain-containing protein [Oerskovia sp. JB1-3-2]
MEGTSMKLKNTRRVALATIGAGLAVTVGALSAAAETYSVTDHIVGEGDGSTSGTTPNGVSWTADQPVEAGGLTSVFSASTPEAAVQTITFGETVNQVSFRIIGLAGVNTETAECVVLPVGVIAETISADHVWTPATRTLCGVNPEGNTHSTGSTFRLENVTSISMQSASIGLSATWFLAQQMDSIQVTVDRERAVLVDDSASTVSGTPVAIDLTTNDDIPEGSSAPSVDTTTANGGTVVDNGDGTITYTPPAGFTGTDTFTYRVTGPDGAEVEATVTITVTEEDEPPVPMVAGGLAVAGLLGLGGVGAARLRSRKEV